MNMGLPAAEPDTSVLPEVGGRPVIVLLPFDQPFLPEFKSFGLFRNYKSILMTNSKDVLSRIDPSITRVDPDFVSLPFSRLLLYKFCYSRSLDGVIRNSQPVAVITFELYSTLSFQVTTSPLRDTFKHIVISYDTVPAHNSLWGMFPPTRFMASFVSRRADFFLGLSRRIGNALEGSGVDRRKIKHVYPGVSSQPLSQTGVYGHDHASPPFRILFLGRLRSNKGLETLIEAFTSLRSEGVDDLELVIAGNGPKESFVTEKAKRVEGMKFAGLLHGEDKRKAFVETDLFVYPSEDTVYLSRFVRWEEQTAAAVREAMSYGKPVIVSDSGSLPELVGRTDVVFRQKEFRELKKKILMLYRSPSLRREISEFNLERSRELFPIDSIAKTVERCLSGS